MSYQPVRSTRQILTSDSSFDSAEFSVPLFDAYALIGREACGITTVDVRLVSATGESRCVSCLNRSILCRRV
jgi:hypothetical protein